MDKQEKGAVFLDLLIASMEDAAVERKLTQLKTEITPQKTGKTQQVRIIIVPESMDMEWPQGLGK